MIDVVTWVFSKCFDNRRFPGCAADHRGDVNHTAGPTEQTEAPPPEGVLEMSRLVIGKNQDTVYVCSD